MGQAQRQRPPVRGLQQLGVLGATGPRGHLGQRCMSTSLGYRAPDPASLSPQLPAPCLRLSVRSGLPGLGRAFAVSSPTQLQKTQTEAAGSELRHHRAGVSLTYFILYYDT